MKTLTKCSKKELDEFVDSYPGKLQSQVYGICDPPAMLFHDFTIGHGWDALVASYLIGDERAPESNWRILVNDT